MKYAAAAAAAVLALAAVPAQATPAHGSFGFVPWGAPITIDTGDIRANTASVKYPASVLVNTVAGGNLGINVGDAVTLLPSTLLLPPGLGTAPVAFKFVVDGLTFTFHTAHTLTRVASGPHSSGDIGVQYDGAMTDSGGLFDTTPAVLSQSCNQSQTGAKLDCSASTLTAAVPEPGSLGILGAALLGFGLWGWQDRRERKAAAL